jgi:hypothetical protein
MLRSAALRSSRRAGITSSNRALPVEHSYVALSSFFRSQENQRWRGSQQHGRASKTGIPAVLQATSSSNSPQRRRGYTTKPDLAEQNVIQEGGSSIKPDIDGETALSKASNPHDMHAHVSSFPRSLRRLAMSLPSSSLRRPTKDEQVSQPPAGQPHRLTLVNS